MPRWYLAELGVEARFLGLRACALFQSPVQEFHKGMDFGGLKGDGPEWSVAWQIGWQRQRRRGHAHLELVPGAAVALCRGSQE